MTKFKLVSPFKPCGDQPRAIAKLGRGLAYNKKHQTLLGVTGSGKTFTMANIIAGFNRPTLVISHNKTLAAQLYVEFKRFFPKNAVEYFVSYYDYYQPEAYIPQRDIYIEKDASINDELDRLRLATTSSLLSRDDCVVVASVSAIYGLGSPQEHRDLFLTLRKGELIERRQILDKLVGIQYGRNDIEPVRGKFRARGDCIEIFPAYSETTFRIEQCGDLIERISEINPLTGDVLAEKENLSVYPARHFVTSSGRAKGAVGSIRKELKERVKQLKKEDKPLEAQRLQTRTQYDIEMLLEIGHCHGIENYSRHLDGRSPGEPPSTLIDYFPEDFLLFVDESHVSISQIRGMYKGDRSRKETLVEHGFRLPSALDNRPLNFEEFEEKINKVIYVSATPGPYELDRSVDIVEQIIRPTGLIDPEIKVKSTKGQVDDLIDQIKRRSQRKQRTLVTTLTKRMAEDLAEYLHEAGLHTRYLHCEVNTLERIETLRDLRVGKFDCLVGINLLREGLDLPEVSLVAILDADREGFLRSQTSLIQVAGRAARNIDGEVIMYADSITGSMQRAISETSRRRKLQMNYNRRHSITPESIRKEIDALLGTNLEASRHTIDIIRKPRGGKIPEKNVLIADMEKEMMDAAENLEFEKAALLRDEITKLKRHPIRQESSRMP